MLVLLMECLNNKVKKTKLRKTAVKRNTSSYASTTRRSIINAVKRNTSSYASTTRLSIINAAGPLSAGTCRQRCNRVLNINAEALNNQKKCYYLLCFNTCGKREWHTKKQWKK